MIDCLQEPTTRAEARASWTPSVAAWPTTPPPGRRSVPLHEEPATRVKARRLLGSVRRYFVDAHLQGEYLGAEPALPYLSPYMRGENLLIATNFASAGVGILNDKGVQFVNIVRIAQQMQNFQDDQRRLAAYIGEDTARERVSQSLVLITLGGNDLVNNYYLVPFSARSQQFEIHDCVPFIVSEYKKVLADGAQEW